MLFLFISLFFISSLGAASANMETDQFCERYNEHLFYNTYVTNPKLFSIKFEDYYKHVSYEIDESLLFNCIGRRAKTAKHLIHNVMGHCPSYCSDALFYMKQNKIMSFIQDKKNENYLIDECKILCGVVLYEFLQFIGQ